jgi:hypothetical protein
MKAVWESILVVEGTGLFPVDMLRYDDCRPAGEEDSYAIIKSIERGHSNPSWEIRVLRRRDSREESLRWTVER